MAGHSILFLGRNDFAPEFIEQLRQSAFAERLHATDTMRVPEEDIGPIDVVLFEAGPCIASSGQTLTAFVQGNRTYPLIALTTRDEEHRGIAAVNAGAQGYLCVDDVTPESFSAVLDHALQRHDLMLRLSEGDTTVLSILGSINDGVIVVDDEGAVLDINPAGRSILGMGPRDMPAGDWSERFGALSPNEDGDEAVTLYRERPLIRAALGDKFEGQLSVYRAPEQADLVLNINGQSLRDREGNRLGGVVTFRDETAALTRSQVLERNAQYDELTGLPNRQLIQRELTRAMGRSGRSAVPLAVLMIGVDKIKSVNETLGHDAGDDLLREIGERLGDNLRIGDFTGRWDGDAFVVCLEDIKDPQDAASVAQKIVLLLSEKYRLRGAELFATPSIGIAMYPESGETAERLINAAELAMLQAKERGGGRLQYYSNSLNRKLEQREELEVGLRHALVRNEFVLHYQPRIDVKNSRLIGLEALLRWQHPRFGLLGPDRFQGILESSGLVHSAGEWTIQTAFRQLAAWQHQFELPDLSLAIKLSAQQLRYGRLVEAVRNALADAMLDAGCIEFEIDNGSIIRQRSAELETLRGLRKLGLRISLDHFGTTEVSLNALDTGVIDSFVLDQTLIHDVENNDSHQRIVRAAIAMARGLDIEVAADGVETVTQLEFLKNCQCDLAQGFLISRPMKADAIPAVLRSEIAGTRLLQRGMP